MQNQNIGLLLSFAFKSSSMKQGTRLVVCMYYLYKMSGRSLSVYKDTSASHEYLCTLIRNGHEFCKLLTKCTQIVIQWNYI